MGIKEKLSIEKITKDDYRDWLLYKHYAKRIPLIKYAFGLRNENNKIVGDWYSEEAEAGVGGGNFCNFDLEVYEDFSGGGV